MPNISEETRKDLFTEDNFTSRRTTGHNLYDPQSTFTEAEWTAGYRAQNSTRLITEPAVYELGPGANLERLGPRVFNNAADQVLAHAVARCESPEGHPYYGEKKPSSDLSERIERAEKGSRGKREDHVSLLGLALPEISQDTLGAYSWEHSPFAPGVAVHIVIAGDRLSLSTHLTVGDTIKLRDFLTAVINRCEVPHGK